MYSLDCIYYNAKFPTLQDLLDDIVMRGMDPNYEITLDGEGIGENAIDFIDELLILLMNNRKNYENTI